MAASFPDILLAGFNMYAVVASVVFYKRFSLHYNGGWFLFWQLATILNLSCFILTTVPTISKQWGG